MKIGKLAFILLSALLLPLFAACSSSVGGKDKIEGLPVKTDKNSDWGMVAPDGKLIFDDEFSGSVSIMINNVFTVRNDGLESVYTMKDGKPRIIGDLEDLYDAGCMTEGLIPITRRGERIEFVDINGKTAFTLMPISGKEVTRVSSRFTDGLAAFKLEDGRSGFINTKGEVVIKPKYDDIYWFNEGYAAATLFNEDDNDDEEVYVILDTKGNETKVRNVEIYSVYHYGFFAAKKSDRMGLLDTKGEFHRLPEKVKSISWFNKKYIIFGDGDNYGMMNHDGEVLIRPKYEELMAVDDNTFVGVTENDKIYLLDNEGERIQEIDAEEFRPFAQEAVWASYSTDFKAIIQEGKNEYRLCDFEGKPIDKQDFYDIRIRASSGVSSDFFEPAAVADVFASYMIPNGFNKFVLGRPMYNYVSGSPEDFAGIDKVTFEGLKGGFQFGLSGYAYTAGYITEKEAVYRTEGYYYTYQVLDHYNYSWDTSATVDDIYVNITISRSNKFEDVKDALIKKLKADGFTLTDSQQAYALLEKGDEVIFISLESSYDKSDITVNITTKSRWESMGASRISSAVDRYNSAFGS